MGADVGWRSGATAEPAALGAAAATLNREGRRALAVLPRTAGDAHAGGGAFAQHVAAEAEQFGGPAAGALVLLAGALDKASGFHQPPQVLLVQMHAGERFNDALELEQRKGGGEQLEYHRAVLELAA